MPADEKHEEEEKGFRIVDRRGAGPSDEASETPAAPPGPADEGQGEEEGDEGFELGEEVEPVDVYGVLRYCIGLLNAHAWQAMGLVPNPVTQKIERDLEQAKVAIDSVGLLVQQLEPKASPEELPQLRALLSDLRLNFARQMTQG